VHQEYPFLMYHATERPRPARNREERLRMISMGWSENPVGTPEAPPPKVMTYADQLEAEELDRQLKEEKHDDDTGDNSARAAVNEARRGRPRKQSGPEVSVSALRSQDPDSEGGGGPERI